MTAISVHVMSLRGDLAARAADLLPPDERRCLPHLPGPRRLEFVLGRALARTVLANRLGCAPAQVPIASAGGGRPALAGCEPMDFNISHSGRHCAVAVTTRGRVGVDLEEVAEYRERLARRWYSPDETAWLRQLPGGERARGFYKLWTVKEACGKARGTGIRPPLDAVSEPAADRGRADGLQWRTWWLSETTVVSVAATCDAAEAADLAVAEPAAETIL